MKWSLPIRSKRKKPVKPVKKNTSWRRFRAWAKRLDRRQEQREAVAVAVDETRRTCLNCGHVYQGKVCPQCGQTGAWSRYSLRQAVLNFLDIWGLGNRPMYRTLKELFWRPGYMVRDYLQGHRQYYFPPFKLMAITLVMVAFVGWLTGIDVVESNFSGFATDEDVARHLADLPFTGFLRTVCYWIFKFFQFLAQSLLYEWLFIGVSVLICVRLAFFKVSRYNLAETYIFLVFVFSQQFLLDTVRSLASAVRHSIETHMLAGGHASAVMTMAGTALSEILDLLAILITLLCLILYIVDFKQFYGLNWKSTIMHLFLAFWIGVIGLATFTGVSVALANRTKFNVMICFVVCAVLLLVTIWLVWHYLNKHAGRLNRPVVWMSRLSAWSVLLMPFLGISLHELGYNVASIIALVTLYDVVLTPLCILPAYLYQRYHKTWLSLVSTTLMLGLAYGVIAITDAAF